MIQYHEELPVDGNNLFDSLQQFEEIFAPGSALAAEDPAVEQFVVEMNAALSQTVATESGSLAGPPDPIDSHAGFWDPSDSVGSGGDTMEALQPFALSASSDPGASYFDSELAEAVAVTTQWSTQQLTDLVESLYSIEQDFGHSSSLPPDIEDPFVAPDAGIGLQWPQEQLAALMEALESIEGSLVEQDEAPTVNNAPDQPLDEPSHEALVSLTEESSLGWQQANVDINAFHSMTVEDLYDETVF